MKRGVIIIAGVVLLVIVTILAIVLSRGDTAVTTEQTISVWSPYDESEAWEALTAAFLKEKSNVKLSYRYIEATDAKDYEAKVVNAIAAGTGPDIWLIRNDWLSKHQTKLTPSTGYVTWSSEKDVTDKQALTSLLGESLLKQSSVGEDLYARPVALDSLALYINNDLVSAAKRSYEDADDDASYDILSTTPKTWSDLATWAKLLTKKSGLTITTSGIALGTVDNTYAASDIYQAMLAQYGGNIFSEDLATVALNLSKTENGNISYPAQQALALYSSFALPSSANYSWNSSMGDPVTAFASGKTAMMIGYSSTNTSIRKINKSLDNVSVISLPQVKDLDLGGKPTSLAAYFTPVITKNSPNAKAAWQLLASFDERAVTEYQKVSLRPTTLDMDAEQTSYNLNDDPGDYEVFAQQVAWSTKIYKPEWQGVDEIIQDAINQVVAQGQSVSTVVDSMTERLKASIK